MAIVGLKHLWPIENPMNPGFRINQDVHTHAVYRPVFVISTDLVPMITRGLSSGLAGHSITPICHVPPVAPLRVAVVMALLPCSGCEWLIVSEVYKTLLLVMRKSVCSGFSFETINRVVMGI